MNVRRHLFGWLILAYFLSSFAGAEIIDKTVAVVENHIITLSDVRREKEIRAFLGENVPDTDAQLIQDLIDKYLIERQSVNFPGVDVTDEEIDAALKNGQVQGQAPSPAIRAAIASRIRTQKYFDLRYRQFIRPSDEQLRKYYDDYFVLEAKKKGLDPIPPLNEITDLIRTNIIQEQTNKEVTDWLDAVRKRSNIEVFE